MKREMVLKIALGVVGALFLVMAMGVVSFFRGEPALAMLLCVYVVLGVFLLLAIRNPGAHRGLIAFTAWSSLAHATLMAAQAGLHIIAHSEWIGVGMFYAIGVVLIVLRPAKVVERRPVVTV